MLLKTIIRLKLEFLAEIGSIFELHVCLNESFFSCCANLTSKIIFFRYNYDVYDRFWDPNVINRDWTQISASISADSLSQNHYVPLALVMSTAATPANASAQLSLMWNPPHVTDQYYVCMHLLRFKCWRMGQEHSILPFMASFGIEILYQSI